MKRIDAHRYIGRRYNGYDIEEVVLYYRVPYRNCFGKMRCKMREVARKDFDPAQTIDDAIIILQGRRNGEVKKRNELRRQLNHWRGV